MKIHSAIASAAFAMLATMTVSSALAQPQWQQVSIIGNRHFVVVNKGAAFDRGVLEKAADSVCGAGKPCVVTFWSDATAVPHSMPMTRTQRDAVVAEYFRNPNSGKNELLLKCRVDNPTDAKCLR